MTATITHVNFNSRRVVATCDGTTIIPDYAARLALANYRRGVARETARREMGYIARRIAKEAYVYYRYCELCTTSEPDKEGA